MTEAERTGDPGAANQKLGLGLGLMALGAIMTLDRLNLIEADHLWRYWPLILILGGLARFLSPPRKGRRGRRGLTLIGVGLLFLADTLGALRFHDSWPLFLVMAGASMALDSRGSRSAAPGGGHEV